MAMPRCPPAGPGRAGLWMPLSEHSSGRFSARTLSQDPPPSLASASARGFPAARAPPPPPPPGEDETPHRKTASPALLNAVGRIQTQAQTPLLMALACERAMRWREAIEYYRQLLKVLNKDKFPEGYFPGPLYTQLNFETYYHLGIAFQKLDSHLNAVEEFTNAIEVALVRKPEDLTTGYKASITDHSKIDLRSSPCDGAFSRTESLMHVESIPNYACQVGCVSRSFLHTPVLARRAYAYVKCDLIKEAISDANKAVELDPLNPDVYCIRALVWSSAKDKRRALVDLNNSSRLNSSHICTLILRGAIINSLGGKTSPRHNQDHKKAFSLCRDSQKFFDVQDFNSPKMSYFYDRYLWSLNAFHTVTAVNLFSGATFLTKATYSQYTSTKLSDADSSQSKMKEPFRCGSVTKYPDNASLLRRKIYSKSLRSDVD